MREVYSTSVSRIGYDAQTKDLHVVWKGDKASVYTGVPPSVADEVMNSWSVGKAVRETVIGNYEHRYLA